MEVLTLNALMHLTRDELCDLAQLLEQALYDLEPGTAARFLVLVSLANIRRVMVMRGLHY